MPSRNLVRESLLTPSDLILPVFVHEGVDLVTPVTSMPGGAAIARPLAAHRRAVRGAWHPSDGAVPVIDASLKTPDGQEALNPDGPCRVVRALKSRFLNSA